MLGEYVREMNCLPDFDGRMKQSEVHGWNFMEILIDIDGHGKLCKVCEILYGNFNLNFDSRRTFCENARKDCHGDSTNKRTNADIAVTKMNHARCQSETVRSQKGDCYRL